MSSELTPQRARQLAELAGRLGLQIKDLDLLDQALSHSSYVHEMELPPESCNERLEFLGDAVLDLVISDMLHHEYPQASEGDLSRARAGVVNTERLAQTAQELGLGSCLLLGRGETQQGGAQKPRILAGALEAVVAALYLDGGLAAARDFLLPLTTSLARRAMDRAPRKDYKTRLQELVQARLHQTPDYRLLSAEGPDHDKVFLVALEIEGRLVARGQGKSKKEAEQVAARRALAQWEPEPAPGPQP